MGTEVVMEPGDVVAGRYRVERSIGAGGFARVYRAVQTDLERTVALKILRPQALEQDNPSMRALDRFEREAKLVSRLENPHTVTVHDYGRLEDGRLYMVMEYVDGRTLSELIEQRGRLQPERVVRVLEQLLDSLREAHAREIIHRDIKPGNVMVFDRIGQQDCVKLLDFGVAKSVAVEQRGAQELTVEGAVIGTPRYMSPEQLRGQPLTLQSDLFSVGVLAYLMYAGEVPYSSNTPAAIIDRMQRFDHDLGALEEAPEPLQSVARGLLAPDCDRRFESAEHALGALKGEGAEPRELAVVAEAGGGSKGSATFPMGFDPEGKSSTTELTGATPSAKTATVAEPSGSRSGGGMESRETDPAEVRGADERPPRREISTESCAVDSVSPPAYSDPRSRWLGLVAGVVAVAGLAGVIWASIGWFGGATESRGTSEPVSEESSEEPPVGREIRSAALSAGRRSVRSGVEKASTFAREVADEQAEESDATAPSEGEPGAADRETEAETDEPGGRPTTGGGGDSAERSGSSSERATGGGAPSDGTDRETADEPDEEGMSREGTSNDESPSVAETGDDGSSRDSNESKSEPKRKPESEPDEPGGDGADEPSGKDRDFEVNAWD